MSPSLSKPSDRHTWQFYRSGGFDQVRLDTLDDLRHLDQLDQKLWVALSCPTQGLEFDPRTLALLDSDQDGHIRAPELMSAIHWALARLLQPSFLLEGSARLPISAIETQSEEGRHIAEAARHVLAGLGKTDVDDLCSEDTENSAAAFAALPLNGDGVVTPDSTDKADLSALIRMLIDIYGGVPDASGKQGLNREIAEQFFTEARSLLAWQQQAPANLGPNTGEALAALDSVAGKIDDYFTRCQLASFDARAETLLNVSDEHLQTLAPLDLAADLESPDSLIAALPLAAIAPNKPLPLSGDVLNPHWAASIKNFQQTVVTPQLGQRQALSQADWKALQAHFAAYRQWLKAQPKTCLSDIAANALEAYTKPAVEQELLALIEADAALAPTANAIHSIDRLVRYTRDLSRLARNFVSFQNFYSGQEKALFQAGTLYLDGRSCDLCIRVIDPAKHAALASLSGLYLAYCDCTYGSEKITIAAAFTAGDSDQLMVGRNGVFYDRNGKDWHATITQIIDHPISLRQSFWSPYKKAARLIGEQVQKLAATRNKQVEDNSAANINQVLDTTQKAAAVGKPATTPPAPFDVARFAGIFAAIGLAVGALGTALASLLSSFLGLSWWQMPLAILGLITIISGPAVLLAWFKLRNRNLGPLLDANGWAVNTRARINLPFGRSLTRMAALPAGAARSLQDPYAEKSIPWLRYGILSGAIAAALIYAYLFWR